MAPGAALPEHAIAATLLQHSVHPAASGFGRKRPVWRVDDIGGSAMGDTKPTIVLVHGAWADASSWAPVATRLLQAGYAVTAPPNNLRGPAADAAYVRAFLETLPGPIVLVGHSYGGVVITNAATGLDPVKALVYVCAFIPDEGQPVAALVGPESALAAALGNPTSVFKIAPIPGAPEGVVDTYLLPSAVASSFAPDVSAEDQAIIAATQRPASFAAVAEPSGAPAWKGIPAFALIGTQDRIIPPAQQHAMAANAGAEVTEIEASHVAMLSQPGAVAALIQRVVDGILQPA
jgi:pimeloyl-ACP methyl ester carboxylesterase